MAKNSVVLDTFGTLSAGLLFGFGLAVSTMIRPESVLEFLSFSDLGLLVVLLSAVGVNLVVYQLLPRFFDKSILGADFQQRPFQLDRSSFLGGVVFGLGWGICGVCPGPAIAGVGAGNFDLLIALAGIFAGALLHGFWVDRTRSAAG